MASSFISPVGSRRTRVWNAARTTTRNRRPAHRNTSPAGRSRRSTGTVPCGDRQATRQRSRYRQVWGPADRRPGRLTGFCFRRRSSRPRLRLRTSLKAVRAEAAIYRDGTRQAREQHQGLPCQRRGRHAMTTANPDAPDDRPIRAASRRARHGSFRQPLPRGNVVVDASDHDQKLMNRIKFAGDPA